MTLQEWLEDFKEVASQFKWKIQVGFSYGQVSAILPIAQIRGTHKNGLGFCGCPLTCYLYAKETKVLPDCMYRNVAAAFDLSIPTVDNIANASDGYMHGSDYTELRKTLLEITGLAEEKIGIVRADGSDIMSCTLVDS